MTLTLRTLGATALLFALIWAALPYTPRYDAHQRMLERAHHNGATPSELAMADMAMGGAGY